jgi:hypothetical protein
MVLRCLFSAKNVPFYGYGVVSKPFVKISPSPPPFPRERDLQPAKGEGEGMERKGDGLKKGTGYFFQRPKEKLCKDYLSSSNI